ncbi:MAG: N-6 DNA methylase, partial [Thermoguttaceae bacterium]|nr:N-6 DNA methylase [Thermoguttaceae bacterium]
FPTPPDEFDFLGAVYQTLSSEGAKNRAGSYYTPRQIAANAAKNWDFSGGATFLDPCCGGGAYLLALNGAAPSQIFGIERDPTAAFIARINLALKFPDAPEPPQIFAFDFLRECATFARTGSLSPSAQILARRFDYIATNPPWGAASADVAPAEIVSRETFSSFFVYAARLLKPGGTARFLLPEAALNVAAHQDLRRFLLETGRVVAVERVREKFAGVTTACVEIEFQNAPPAPRVIFRENGVAKSAPIEAFRVAPTCVFAALDDLDLQIIRRAKTLQKYDLHASRWGMGIVTGDNKSTLKDAPGPGLEPIYTGREVGRYALAPPRKFLRFDRSRLQQAAPDEFYRAPEKLAYRFISNRLIFAYDDGGSLFLNSANLLEPRVPGTSVKTALALLNSELFNYLRAKTFGGVKILKSELLELPFPEISPADDDALSRLVDRARVGDVAADAEIQRRIFRIFQLTPPEIARVASENARRALRRN